MGRIEQKERPMEENLFLEGDFNEIRHPLKKQGGRLRNEDSCKEFQDFIQMMNIEEVGV